MRLLYLFIALSVFYCYSSISSTVDAYAAEKQSQAPSCHILSGSGIAGSDVNKEIETNLNPVKDEISESCCLLGLLNSKGTKSDLQVAQIFTTLNYYTEAESSASFNKSVNYFDNGYDPPDIIILKSSFLI